MVSLAVKLKNQIRHHIDGTGNGYDLDDVMSRGLYPEWVSDAIYDIAKKHENGEYPIGISNPASNIDLELLIEKVMTDPDLNSRAK